MDGSGFRGSPRWRRGIWLLSALILLGLAFQTYSLASRDEFAFLDGDYARRVEMPAPPNYYRSYVLVCPKDKAVQVRNLLRKELALRGFAVQSLDLGKWVSDDYENNGRASVTYQAGLGAEIEMGNKSVSAGDGQALVLVERGPTWLEKHL